MPVFATKSDIFAFHFFAPLYASATTRE